MQVRLCRAKTTGEIYAMKKLKKSDMLSRGQVSGLLDFYTKCLEHGSTCQSILEYLFLHL